MKSTRFFTASVLCTIALTSCTLRYEPGTTTPPPAKENPPKPAEPAKPGPMSGRLRIMAYNVENLFDTQHDKEKNDWEFLPKETSGKKEFCEKEPPQYQKTCLAADWTEDKLEIKLGQIAKVFAKATPAPDLLALTEVENEGVVRRLADRLGYKFLAITESPDERGIDVALLYNETANLRFVAKKVVEVDTRPHGGKPARDLLIVEFEYGQNVRRKLAVIVNHWPSQNNQLITRRLNAERVRDLAKAYVENGVDILATGDFNVESVNDYPTPFQVFDEIIGGAQLLTDIDRIARARVKDLGIDVSRFSPGTYFYFNQGSKTQAPAFTWNMLDRFFVSNSLLARVDLKSYRILNDPEFTTSVNLKYGPMAGTTVTGVPWRYSHDASAVESAGFSDHFPIVVEFEFE